MSNKGVWKSFLEDYDNKSTKKIYRWGLTHFFKSVYGENAVPEECAEKYFAEGRTEEDYEEDVKHFFNVEKHRPPASVGKFLSVVRLLMDENHVILRRTFWNKLSRRKKGSRGITVDRPPTVTEMREILTHMDAKGKAFFLTLASSGMRIGEALALKLKDVELDKDPVRIIIRKSKTGTWRWAFISTEAKEAVTAWLKNRKDYAQSAVRKTWHRHAEGRKYLKSLKGRKQDPEEVKALIERISEKVDNRVFPFKETTAFAMWTNALTKSGLDQRDETTKIYMLHIHTLRKFARTQLGTVHPTNIAQSLVGHKRGMDKIYEMFSPDQLGKYYKQAEHALTIFGNPAIDIEKVKEEIKLEAKVEVKYLKERIGELERGVEDLSEKYLASAKAFEKTAKMVDDMSKTIVKLMDEKVKTS
jgi:integrase